MNEELPNQGGDRRRISMRGGEGLSSIILDVSREAARKGLMRRRHQKSRGGGLAREKSAATYPNKSYPK